MLKTHPGLVHRFWHKTWGKQCLQKLDSVCFSLVSRRVLWVDIVIKGNIVAESKDNYRNPFENPLVTINCTHLTL